MQNMHCAQEIRKYTSLILCNFNANAWCDCFTHYLDISRKKKQLRTSIFYVFQTIGNFLLVCNFSCVALRHSSCQIENKTVFWDYSCFVKHDSNRPTHWCLSDFTFCFQNLDLDHKISETNKSKKKRKDDHLTTLA